jgi:3-oxoacyl-[acyl-carrier protein] reductase
MHVTAKRLLGKRAFVTGGSRGIGAAIVDRLAEEDAAVAFTHRGQDQGNGPKKHSKTNDGGMEIQADSADPDALTQAVEKAAKNLSGIDIFVSNAGKAA